MSADELYLHWTDGPYFYKIDGGPDDFFVARYTCEDRVDPEYGPHIAVTESSYLTADGTWVVVPELGLLPAEVRHQYPDPQSGQ